jgi:lysozyme
MKKKVATKKNTSPQKSNNYKFLWLIILLILAPLIGYIIYKYKKDTESKFVFYKAFGIKMPTNYSIHGIDVSKFQNTIYWPSVKKMKVDDITIKFAFIKATEGSFTSDEMFDRNWKLCRDNKIVRGGYHYFIPSRDGKQQAENFIKKVQLLPGDLPPVVDIEQDNNLPKSIIQQRLKECLHQLELHYKTKPIIYSNADFYETNLGEAFSKYPLWVAHYQQLYEPNINRDFIFWQHNEKATISGITSKVDCNVFNGSSSDFEKLLVE